MHKVETQSEVIVVVDEDLKWRTGSTKGMLDWVVTAAENQPVPSNKYEENPLNALVLLHMDYCCVVWHELWHACNQQKIKLPYLLG